ncbi:hypothetical protein NC652_018836 [Populus alba x Populus x berolinensis]|nr:hypothetical protein NC652_018836 [Populus alba x Populus x berolinensis]
MDFSKYLGFPVFHMRMKKADFNFLLEKISKRLASWKEKILNRVGRISLANQLCQLFLFILCRIIGYHQCLFWN